MTANGIQEEMGRLRAQVAALEQLLEVHEQVVLDQTERLEQTLGDLRENEIRTRLLIDTAQEAFVSMDREGRINYWNPQAEQIFGWSRQEVLGRMVAETIIPPRYREAHQQGLQRFLETGLGPVLNQRLELSALHRDGHEFPVELTISAVPWQGTYLFGAFIHDITARKQAEDELLQAKETAEAANRAKSEFLARMSHEIRTPMNGILGMTELTLDTELTHEQRDYLEMVKTSAESLLSVIDDILDFSKIEARKLQLDSIGFDLWSVVGDTLRSLAVRADQKGLELACHIPSEVPQAVVGDPGRLRQVIVNLVGNAIKFTERGEVVADVQVEGQSEGVVCLHFTIHDTGIGIPCEEQQRIFDPFAQADASTTRRYGGTGLGLTITAQLIAMMGGRIWVESAVGQGSTFHFTVCLGLPQSPAAPPALSGTAPEEEAGIASARSAASWPANMTGVPVLVVDDNATNRRILEEILAHWGMRPLAVASGQAALAALERAAAAGEPFPLVLLDGHMPEMDGFTLAGQIQQRPELTGTTILMLTSAGHPEDTVRCRQMGISAYLLKPVKRSELATAIQTALGRSCQPSGAPSAPTSRPLSAGRQPLHILLAEDNRINQKLAVRLLEKEGHTVVLAGTGQEALDQLKQQTFDLVLMDVEMPELDGLAATTHIRRQEEGLGLRLPIIAMTAHALKGDRERCLSAGMDGYVAKPIRAQELFAAIEAVRPASAGPCRSGPAEAGRTASLDPKDGFDRLEALARVCGDEGLLRELVVLFLSSCPELVAELSEAVAQRDSTALQRVAHTIKGGVGTFGRSAVFEAAQLLETLGRNRDWSHVEEACKALEEALANLKPALAGLLEERPAVDAHP